MHKSTVICEKKKHVMKRKSLHLRALRWRHNGCDGVSNHQPHDCLLNSLFGCRSEKHQSSASLAFVLGIQRGPVNSLHKWPVTRKMFPFDDVIMGFSSLDAPAASHLENFRGLSDENFARMTTSASRCLPLTTNRKTFSYMNCNKCAIHFIFMIPWSRLDNELLLRAQSMDRLRHNLDKPG